MQDISKDYCNILKQNKDKELWIRRYSILNKKEDENKIIIWPDLPYWLYVNEEVLQLLHVLNGSTLDNVVRNYRDKEIGFEEQILDIVGLLMEAGAASFDREFVDEEPRKEYVLQYITLNITNTCNLFCKHCYIDASREKKEYMTFEEAKEIIDKLAPIMIPTCNVIVSGGEALLNKDCIKILKYFNTIGKGKLTLVTNGTFITPSISKELKNVTDLAVQVSLDGASKAVHEKIRGQNTYEKTLNGIKILAKDEHKIYLSPIVTEELFEELDAYFSLASELNVLAVFLQPVNCVGRARDNGIKRVDDSQVFKRVIDLYENTTNLIGKIPGSLEMKHLTSIRLLDRCFYCGTGSSTLCIQPNGDIYPCPNTIVDELKIGNAFFDNVKELWFQSPILNELRNINVNKNLDIKCRDCEVKYFCGGGCRGTAFQNTGSLYSLSGTCEYEKKQRIEMLWYVAQKPEMFREELKRSLEILNVKDMETRMVYKALTGSP